MFEHVGLFCSCEGRYCGRCDQMKCHRAFSKDSKGKLGLSPWCKDCWRDYHQKNKDQINIRRKENRQEKADQYNAYNREYHHNNPEPKKARDKKYRQERLEEFNAYMREYRKTYEGHREYNRQYVKLHPEKSAQNFNNRRARVLQAGGEFTSREWKKLCKHYNYTCLCCGKREPEIKLTIDHVIPLSKGGTNLIDNIQPLCQSCNSSKARSTIDYRVNWGKES